jgi:hypothetical protein
MATKTQVVIEDRLIDGKRPLGVVYVGAGVSGFITAIRFPQSLQYLELQICEKNVDLGGTWFEIRYWVCMQYALCPSSARKTRGSLAL